jgi:hypothetical protein
MGNRMGNRVTAAVKLMKSGSAPKLNGSTVYSGLRGELFELSHYAPGPAVPLEMDENVLRDIYGEEELEGVAPSLLELEEDEAGVLLQFMSRSEGRSREDWYAELAKQNFHFSDAPNNPFNKKFSYTVKSLLEIGLLDELREDAYGNTHYKVSKTGRRLLAMQRAVGTSSYFPLEDDTKKEEFYYTEQWGDKLWESLLADITKERYRFPLPGGGFGTYQSRSEADVSPLTTYGSTRKPRELPDSPEPFTYRERDNSAYGHMHNQYTSSRYDFYKDEAKEIDFPTFYGKFEKDWAGYELLDSSTQKPATKYQPKGHSEPLIDDRGMKKNLDFTGRAMAQHLNRVLSQNSNATELFLYSGEWYSDPYAWSEDGTAITLASKNPATGEVRQLSVPFNQFAKFYDRRKNYRFVDLQSSQLDDEGKPEEINHLAVFEGEKMVGLLPLGTYGYVPALRDNVVAYYATKYPALRNVVASIHSEKRSRRVMKLEK